METTYRNITFRKNGKVIVVAYGDNHFNPTCCNLKPSSQKVVWVHYGSTWYKTQYKSLSDAHADIVSANTYSKDQLELFLLEKIA